MKNNRFYKNYAGSIKTMMIYGNWLAGSDRNEGVKSDTVTYLAVAAFEEGYTLEHGERVTSSLSSDLLRCKYGISKPTGAWLTGRRTRLHSCTLI
jgi:hypothetical protein